MFKLPIADGFPLTLQLSLPFSLLTRNYRLTQALIQLVKQL